MENLNSIPTFTCESAYTLLAKKKSESLTLNENIKLNMHLQLCSICNKKIDSSLPINDSLKALIQHRFSNLDDLKSKDLKTKIIKSIKLT